MSGDELYAAVLDRWNANDADGFAGLFADDGSLVGFDGSMVDGRDAIRSHLAEVFGSHTVASYVGKVREVRRLADGGAVLVRAVAGMVPPGKDDLDPAVNTVHSLVAGADGRIALFHATPAAFHGRPEAVDELTTELRSLLR